MSGTSGTLAQTLGFQLSLNRKHKLLSGCSGGEAPRAGAFVRDPKDRGERQERRERWEHRERQDQTLGFSTFTGLKTQRSLRLKVRVFPGKKRVKGRGGGVPGPPGRSSQIAGEVLHCALFCSSSSLSVAAQDRNSLWTT